MSVLDIKMYLFSSFLIHNAKINIRRIGMTQNKDYLEPGDLKINPGLLATSNFLIYVKGLVMHFQKISVCAA